MRPVLAFSLVLCLTVILAACSGISGTGAPPSGSQPTATIWRPPTSPTVPPDKASCEALGGKWGIFGQKETCNLPTTDGGKVCSDSRDCQGSCLADLTQNDLAKGAVTIQGKCTPWKITQGCLALVRDGKVYNILCTE